MDRIDNLNSQICYLDDTAEAHHTSGDREAAHLCEVFAADCRRERDQLVAMAGDDD